jgi:hypothetical protein
MTAPEVTYERVEKELRRLPTKRLKQVLLFVQFLEHVEQQGATFEDTEDEDLWNAVLAHQHYRAGHPEETPEVFDSPDSFLKSTENW